MKTKAILVLFSISSCGMATAADYAVKDGSTLEFIGTFQGEEFQGRFDRFDASIRYDPAQLGDSKFDVSIDLASASTGDSERDVLLPDKEFFAVAEHPKAQFVTSQFHKSGDKIVAEGTLSLKGISEPVELELTFVPDATGATLDVLANMNRLEFKVGTGDYADTSTIGDEVKIQAHLILEPK